jgi:hypothetical protein
MRSVLGSHYFKVAVGSNVNHYTHGYKPYRFLAEALIDFLLDDRPCTMRDPRGRAQERPARVKIVVA